MACMARSQNVGSYMFFSWLDFHLPDYIIKVCSRRNLRGWHEVKNSQTHVLSCSIIALSKKKINDVLDSLDLQLLPVSSSHPLGHLTRVSFSTRRGSGSSDGRRRRKAWLQPRHTSTLKVKYIILYHIISTYLPTYLGIYPSIHPFNRFNLSILFICLYIIDLLLIDLYNRSM